MTFQVWLSKQKERQDHIGRLAREWADFDLNKHIYAKRRRKDEHMKWATVLTRYGSQRHVQSFNQAWQEFTQANVSSVS